jgi:hypothetical protein
MVYVISWRRSSRVHQLVSLYIYIENVAILNEIGNDVLAVQATKYNLNVCTSRFQIRQGNDNYQYAPASETALLNNKAL